MITAHRDVILEHKKKYNKTNKKNIHILVDYDNVYITLDKNYVRHDRPNLRSDIVTNLISKYKNDNICEIKLFLDFQTIHLLDNEFEIFKNNHIKLEHVYSGKNASDVYLMLEIMKTLECDNEIDKFIIISSDSDMLPIVNELKRRRKEVVVAYFSLNTDENYIKYLETIVDDCFSIESLLGIEKYIEENKEYLSCNMDIIIKTINNNINEIYDKYTVGNKHGTFSKKGVRDLFEKSRVVVRSDISLAINYLFDEINALTETDYKITHKKVLINEQFINNNNIKLDRILREENFV